MEHHHSVGWKGLREVSRPSPLWAGPLPSQTGLCPAKSQKASKEVAPRCLWWAHLVLHCPPGEEALLACHSNPYGKTAWGVNLFLLSYLWKAKIHCCIFFPLHFPAYMHTNHMQAKTPPKAAPQVLQDKWAYISKRDFFLQKIIRVGFSPNILRVWQAEQYAAEKRGWTEDFISVGNTRPGSYTKQGQKSWFKWHTIRALISLHNAGRTWEIYIWYIIQHNSLFEGVTYAKQDDIRSQESTLHIAELITMTVLKSGRKRINRILSRGWGMNFNNWNIREESLLSEMKNLSSWGGVCPLGVPANFRHLGRGLATVAENKLCI